MTTPIDDKVVAMSFESSKFEKGVNNSLSALDKLKAALHFPNAGKQFNDIDAAARKMNFGHLAKGIDDVKHRLDALRLAAIAVFSQIATRAIAAGSQLVKSFTIAPLTQGFQEYTTNLNAIQTILANTKAAGTDLQDVNTALQELNEYSDKTIYNFSQMAKNIGTFTAAGVDLDRAVGSIKGIANLAAVSGSSAEQAATAMYQLSQAISSGRVSLQDWNSVVNAGMGGTVFQRALAQTAEAMGTLDKGAVKLKGSMKNVTIAGKSFRESIQAGPGKTSWLTSDVLTATLEQFTGDLTKAELKAQGFNDAQIKAIQETAIMAQKAATEVKTLSGVLTTAQETAASGWAQTWQIIFGDFGEAKTLFTGISNAINGFISASADARNKTLQDWKDLGGRTVLIDSLRTAFQNLGMILRPIKQAFRDIFPAKTGADLMYLTQRFERFAESLRPSQETVENLRRTFRGFFAILSIAGQVISGVFSVFTQLFGAVGEGSGSFLNFTGSIGDWLVSVDKALKKGDRLKNFFQDIGDFLEKPIALLSRMAGALADLFAGFSPGGISDELNGITSAMSPLEKMVKGISTAWSNLLNSFEGSGSKMQPIIQGFADMLSGLGTAIGEAASNMNFEAILEVIRVGLLGGLVLLFKRFLGKGSLVEQLAGSRGIFGNISGLFDSLTGSMTAMQNNLKAKTLKEIAIAIALLSASVVALSFVDPERLKSSLTAMTVAFGQLLGAMAILGNISQTMGFVKMPIIAASMILLAGAITVLSAAVVILAQLSWEELAKGLGGVVVLLGAVSAAVIPLSANSSGMIRAGAGIMAIAIAMNLLALAVRQFASMSLSDLGKGLGSVAIGLTVMVTAMAKMPAAGMIRASIGINAIAVALNLLALAVRQFASMSVQELGKGLGAVAISLGTIVAAMKVMPKNMLRQAAALVVIAGALNLIALAVKTMGGMSIREIAKGLGTLAGSLIILGVAMKFIAWSVRGAIALSMIAAAMALLAPALVLLGRQSWSSILKSLVTLAGALTVLGVAGLLLAPTIPALLGLGAALLLIGGGLALAGAGIALISAGLSALAIAGPTAIGILVAAFNEYLEAIPEFAKNLAIGLLQIVQAFAKVAPQLVVAMGKILVEVLNVIIQAAPKMGEAFEALLIAGLKVLDNNSGKLVQSGMNLLIDLLKGIRNNIGQITTIVSDIIVKFLQSLSSNAGRIVRAGFDLLIQFLRGIGNNIARVGTAVVDIITRFIRELGENWDRIRKAGTDLIVKFVGGIAASFKDVVTAGARAIGEFVKGVGSAAESIVRAATTAAGKFIKTLATQIVKLADDVFEALITLINGMAQTINNRAPELQAAGLSLGWAIINGMTFGLAGKARDLYNKASEIAGKVLSILKAPWKVLSPSKTMRELGENIMLGMAYGMSESASNAYNSARAVSEGVIGSFEKAFQIQSPSKVMMEIGRLVGQGFAEGLKGSGEDIRGAFTDLNEKLTDAMVDARETIASEQEKLDKLRASKKPDEAAIRKSQEVIKQNEDLLARSRAGHIALTKALRDEKAELLSLAGDYEKVGEKLKKAEQALIDAKRLRDDAIAGFEQQYGALPDIVREFQDEEGKTQMVEDQLGPYMKALEFQANSIAAYQATLQELRKLGLDDATYRKLLAEGPANQHFANQLLAGGKTAIESLNTLDYQLMTVSKTLAVNAGKNLYQAGVDAADGLVKGLKKKRSDIREEMEEIARMMIRALKKELGIKSPSQVFAEIGRYSMEGMAKGFEDSKNLLVGAIDDVTDDAMAAMKRSVNRIASVVSDELNPNPTITPVLDLTQIRSQSNEMASIITAAGSRGQAASILAEQSLAELDDVAGVAGGVVKFEQNNYSPKALTEVEIYRQTKNQLSQLKSVLATT